MEHPQEIIRMLFIAIILVFSIIIIYNLMTEIEVDAEYKVKNLKYNAITARILYSSDCYAWEEGYYLWDGTTKRYQVHAGILNLSKLKEDDRLSKCIKNAQYKSNITYKDEEYIEKTGECEGWKREERILTLINDNGVIEQGFAEIKVCVP